VRADGHRKRVRQEAICSDVGAERETIRTQSPRPPTPATHTGLHPFGSRTASWRTRLTGTGKVFGRFEGSATSSNCSTTQMSQHTGRLTNIQFQGQTGAPVAFDCYPLRWELRKIIYQHVSTIVCLAHAQCALTALPRVSPPPSAQYNLN
jgi:hypothetical protein